MKGVFLVFVASIVALATGQDCPAYYVRSQSGQSCYRYFNMRVPYYMASEFCEMVTPCGNGPAAMGSLVAVNSAMENFEVYQLVASFSQDNQMENEIWLGWNTQNPYFWEDGSPAYPNGFSAFTGAGAGGGAGGGRPGMGGRWPVDPANPFARPPGSAPIMKRQNPGPMPRPGAGQPPPGVGPQWDLAAVTSMRAFVCEVAIGQNLPPGAGQQPGMNQPGMGGQRPGMGGRPGMGPQQPGMGPQQPGMGGRPGMGPQQPGMGPQQPGMGPQQPGMGGQPGQPGTGNPRFQPRPRMLETADAA